MWRDVSRSAFVFGIGTFLIVSSSYAKDINLRLEILNYIEFTPQSQNVRKNGLT